MKIFSAVIVFLLITGCGDPKIDTSTIDTTQESIEKVRAALPDKDKIKFDKALSIIVFSQVDIDAVFSSSEIMWNEETKSILSGKTAQEVIGAAEVIKKRREEKEKKRISEEIKELEQKKSQAETALAELSNFEIISAEFYRRQDETFKTEKPVVELTVKNNTGYPVSRVVFEGILSSPGRLIPWVKDSFHYDIPGGLEPGEDATWALGLNQYSPWGTVQLPDDVVLNLRVMRLYGADREKLFEANGFSDYNKKKLAELKEKLKELEK